MASKRPTASTTAARGRALPVAQPASASWRAWAGPGFMAATLACAWFGQEQLGARHLTAGLLFWAAAGIFMLLAFWPQPERRTDTVFSPRTEALVLSGIVVLAAAFRFIRLDTLPNGFFFDEAMNALEGLQMLRDPKYLPLFGPPDAPIPALHFYLNALALKLGGVGALAPKLMTAAWGTLTVAAVYFLARRLVSAPVALAAAVLMAVLRWHVNFSRINFIGINTPLFGALAMYFLLRGIETKNRWHMALSGLAVSMGMYTYYASNLVPFVIGPYLVLQLAWDRRFLAGQWKGVLIFLGVSLAVFSPLAHLALTEPGRYFSRNGQVLIFNHVPPEQAAKAFWTNVKTTLLMFNYFGDTNGRHNIPEMPMLDPLTGLAFGLGLLWSVTHVWRRGPALLVLWFVVALVPGFLSIEAPQGYRCIGAIVPVVLLAAVGVERIWQGLLGLVPEPRYRGWLLGALGAGLAAIVWANGTDYFVRQAEHQACWSEFSAREAAIGRRVHELGSNTHAIISAAIVEYPTVRYLGYPHLDAEPFHVIQSIPSAYQGSKDLAYLLLPIHESALPVLKSIYPQGVARTQRSPYEYNLFTEYVVTAAALRDGRGLAAAWRDASGRVVERRDGQDALILERVLPGAPGTVSVRWQGSLRVPNWMWVGLRVEGAVRSAIIVDGEPLPADGKVLYQGLHALEVTAAFASGEAPAALQWRQGRSGGWEAVPGQHLSPRTGQNGLVGTYYGNADLAGEPRLRRLDPLFSLIGADFPLVSPFSVRWEGKIRAPRTGVYSLGLQVNETGRILVDGEELVNNGKPDTYAENARRLTQGEHDLVIEYRKSLGAYPTFILSWTPPGKGREPVPYGVLTPR